MTAGVAGLWIYFLLYILKSMKHSPQFQDVDVITSDFPAVSIILPARNEERYIGPCLESLIAQNYPNFEIIAINDSSSDGTEEQILHYAATEPRLVYVKAAAKPE